MDSRELQSRPLSWRTPDPYCLARPELTSDRLAYCWGLVFAIYLMGHGLVAVPRRLFRNADVAGRLRRLQAHAPKVHDRLTTAIAELEDLEIQVILLRQRKHGISRDHQEWIEELADMCDLPEARPSSSVPPTGATIPAVITDRYLAEVSRKLNRTRHKRIRFIDTWDRLVRQAYKLQTIIDASPSKKLDFGKPSPQASFLERLTLLTPYTRWVLYAKIIPGLRLMYGTIFTLASIFVVWSELIKFAAPRLSMISLTVVTYRGEDAEVNFVGQLFSSLWLLYMCTATLASFQDVKIWGNRALVRRNTYGESAAWYSGQVAKLTVPLAYNFITFLPGGVHKETTFYQFLGSLIDLTPLGKGFDYFFPMFILLPVCATLFNLYGRARNIFKFGIVEDDDDETPPGFGGGGWREGQALIEADLQGKFQSGLREGHTSPRSSGNSTPIGLGSQAGQVQNINVNSITPRQKPVRSNTGERQAQRLADATRAAEEEDENIFQGFAHRVRNTFDTVDRPEWLSDLGRRPKWMGGVDGNTESSGRAESGRGMGRWFGGRPADGQVRL